MSQEVGFWTSLFGLIFSILIFAFIVALLGMFKLPKRLKGHPVQYRPPNESETADWLNIIMARINVTHVDTELLAKVCEILSEKIANLPEKPDFLTEATLKPLRSADSAPFISDIQLQSTENESSISFLLHYQGSPSIQLSATASGGPFDLAQLFSFSLSVELLLCLLVARVTIIFSNDPNDENKQITVNVGNDLIVDIDVKPLLGDPKNASQKHIESISTWFSNFIIKELRGKSFKI